MKRVLLKATQTAIRGNLRTPILLLAYVVFANLHLVASYFENPLIILALLIPSLGWFGARFIYLHESFSDRLDLRWQLLPQRLLRVVVLLLPLITVLFLMMLLPMILMILWYGKWYAASTLNSGVGMTTIEVSQSFLLVLFDIEVWQEFFRQSWVHTIFLEGLNILFYMGLLVIKTALILNLLEQYPVAQATFQAFNFLIGNVKLVVGFVIACLGIIVATNVFLELMFYWLSVPLMVLLVVSTCIQAYGFYLLDRLLLAYYRLVGQKSLWRRNLMRWWRSHGRAKI